MTVRTMRLKTTDFENHRREKRRTAVLSRRIATAEVCTTGRRVLYLDWQSQLGVLNSNIRKEIRKQSRSEWERQIIERIAGCMGDEE